MDLRLDLRLGDPPRMPPPMGKPSAIISHGGAKPSEVETHHHTHADTQHHKQQNNIQHRVSTFCRAAVRLRSRREPLWAAIHALPRPRKPWHAATLRHLLPHNGLRKARFPRSRATTFRALRIPSTPRHPPRVLLHRPPPICYPSHALRKRDVTCDGSTRFLRLSEGERESIGFRNVRPEAVSWAAIDHDRRSAEHGALDWFRRWRRLQRESPGCPTRRTRHRSIRPRALSCIAPSRHHRFDTKPSRRQCVSISTRTSAAM